MLGLTSSHGGDEYDQLRNGAGELVLQLHAWDAHEYPLLGDPAIPARGNGTVLWFEVDAFDAVLERIHAASATIFDGPLVNALASHYEVWLRDPDGYVVVVASAYGTA